MKRTTRQRVEDLKARSLALMKSRLERKHADLEDQIGREARRPLPDTLKLQLLKRRRLKVKERLANLEGVLRTLAAGPMFGARLKA